MRKEYFYRISCFLTNLSEKEIVRLPASSNPQEKTFTTQLNSGSCPRGKDEHVCNGLRYCHLSIAVIQGIKH